MTMSERIDTFLGADAFGVVGASRKPHKYGNKVLRCYQQNQRIVVPVNPVEKEIEGLACVASVSDLPDLSCPPTSEGVRCYIPARTFVPSPKYSEPWKP